MFSPDVTVHAGTATRNPRRRQRTGSEDSVALRQNPKRLRRSRLSSETFQPPAIKQVNGYTDHGDGSSVANGCPQHVTSIQHASVDTASLAIRHRGPKQLDKERKGSRANGSIELVSYTRFPRCVTREANFTYLRPKMKIISSLNFQPRPSNFKIIEAQVRISLSQQSEVAV